ncbi:hypothetical protein DH2020_024011 [Rehmannia glutinosa]|uniref:fructose-bisphosphatase n=1 Tax=Rehmannia glutinosa TaxID=99300 RepID=A0ABR0W7L5_REHGL
MAFLGGLSFKINAIGPVGASGDDGFQTLAEFMGKGGQNVGDELVVLFSHLEYACKKIAALVASPFNSNLAKNFSAASGSDERDKPKPLDIVANEIILSSLKNSGKVAVMASEEDDAPVWLADDGPFVVVLDPLDGSRNIDASIPTGTIFGIYKRLVELDHLPPEKKALLNSLQRQIYSVNDARYFDWPEGLRQYIDTVRQGKGKHPKKYSARYICSLVADFHRTLLYGGVAMNPRDHLRLVYEANPLSFLAEQAGGKGSDGKVRILNLQPFKLHQRLPLFLGSPDDIEELESYGDVQQKVNPGYDV